MLFLGIIILSTENVDFNEIVLIVEKTWTAIQCCADHIKQFSNLGFFFLLLPEVNC